MSEWESVTPERDSIFIGWGDTEGQVIIGKVTYVGTGRDINDNPCPQLAIELTEPGTTYAKGEKSDIDAGTTVTLTCGQSNLKKNITRADLSRGDLVRIELESFFPTAKGKAKIFDVKVQRGAGGPVASPQAPPAQSSFDDSPPF